LQRWQVFLCRQLSVLKQPADCWEGAKIREGSFVAPSNGLESISQTENSRACVYEKVLTRAGVEFTNGDQPGARLRDRKACGSPTYVTHPFGH
jgi:3-deoxy-D-manno-octulosonic acid (KDO) 8-phosphate synthase